MSLIRRLPKRGFTNAGKVPYQVINVERLNSFRKDSSVDKQALRQAGFLKSFMPVKILGDGKLSKPLHIRADAFSESAKKKILEAGGKFEINGTKTKK